MSQCLQISSAERLSWSAFYHQIRGSQLWNEERKVENLKRCHLWWRCWKCQHEQRRLEREGGFQMWKLLPHLPASEGGMGSKWWEKVFKYKGQYFNLDFSLDSSLDWPQMFSDLKASHVLARSILAGDSWRRCTMSKHNSFKTAPLIPWQCHSQYIMDKS